ncbi:nucleotidyl transferase AbiEii/AbiGii toxin family protein [Glutamicibacter sp. NPDC087344]|uniref:nucleotidyl transferase AbiEii/AbiGii toxin family protein n=1 Tax=Glutamicibacter sp. NPDC087344 TaxID=3363994 RepID=UPI0037F42E08
MTRRRTSMALVIVGQLLPECSVKGGSAMALRYGAQTRFTKDLDAARTSGLSKFRSDFEERLLEGWEGFTGRLVEKKAPRPAGVPTAYVMKPFEIKISYKGKAWCTVSFELGHNEIGDAENPEPILAQDLADLFTSLGFPAPSPVPVVPVVHQVAQKIHASTAPGSERARDLVDLQLLGNREQLDLRQIKTTCLRLFDYRNTHLWPPTVVEGPDWQTLYAEAAQGLDVAHDVDSAIVWVNALIVSIDRAVTTA